MPGSKNLSQSLQPHQRLPGNRGGFSKTVVLKVWSKNDLLKNHRKAYFKMQFSTPSPGLAESESLGMGPEICILSIFLFMVKSQNHGNPETTLKWIIFPGIKQDLLNQKPQSAFPNFLPTICLYSRSSKLSSALWFWLPIVVKLRIKDLTDFD